MDLVAKARARYDAMTPAERAEMSRRQARSWGRAEAAFGSDADEAEYAAALASGDPDRIAEVKRKEEQRLDAYDEIDRLRTDAGAAVALAIEEAVVIANDYRNQGISNGKIRDWNAACALVDAIRALATPEALATSPEVAKLVADAEARGMERALETMKTAGDSAVTEAMGQRLCCNGQDCGCHGATVEQYLEHLIRAEASAIRRAAEETGT